MVRAEAQEFLRLLEAHYGQRPIIYTPIDFYRDAELWKVGGTEFWLRSVAGHPQDVFGARPWSFWQYSSTGRVPGIRGKVDLNVFAGSADDWARWVAVRTR